MVPDGQGTEGRGFQTQFVSPVDLTYSAVQYRQQTVGWSWRLKTPVNTLNLFVGIPSTDDTPLIPSQYTCCCPAQTINWTTDFTIFIQTFCFIQSIQSNSVRKSFNNQQWKILIEQHYFFVNSQPMLIDTSTYWFELEVLPSFIFKRSQES